MCRDNPAHNCTEIIVGKVWLIGRSYAAAIERRKKYNDSDIEDDFYFNVVAPRIMDIGSELDERINFLKKFDFITEERLKDIVDTHLFLTNVFSDITGLNKRSLASKYLHFHAPKMFYIYDSRAIKAARNYIMPNKELQAWLNPFGDKDYIQLVIRLYSFQKYIENKFGILIKPRDIDAFLLNY